VKALIVVLLVVGFVVTYRCWVAAVDRRCGAVRRPVVAGVLSGRRGRSPV
jgi:hypothetical protein